MNSLRAIGAQRQAVVGEVACDERGQGGAAEPDGVGVAVGGSDGDRQRSVLTRRQRDLGWRYRHPEISRRTGNRNRDRRGWVMHRIAAIAGRKGVGRRLQLRIECRDSASPTVAVPSTVDPFMKVTVPVGIGVVEVVPMTVATSTTADEEAPVCDAPRLVS